MKYNIHEDAARVARFYNTDVWSTINSLLLAGAFFLAAVTVMARI